MVWCVNPSYPPHPKLLNWDRVVILKLGYTYIIIRLQELEFQEGGKTTRSVSPPSRASILLAGRQALGDNGVLFAADQ